MPYLNISDEVGDDHNTLLSLARSALDTASAANDPARSSGAPGRNVIPSGVWRWPCAESVELGDVSGFDFGE
jgi:hypothetical protein